jgi:hypothetical protein
LNRLLFCLPSKKAGIGLDASFQIVIRATSSSGISSRRCGRRVGGARSLCHSFRRWLVPIAGPASYGDVNEYLPKFKQVMAEAGRDPSVC